MPTHNSRIPNQDKSFRQFVEKFQNLSSDNVIVTLTTLLNKIPEKPDSAGVIRLLNEIMVSPATTVQYVAILHSRCALRVDFCD